jgi:hypothetical protein
MLNKDKTIIQIADFGLSRKLEGKDYYRQIKNVPLPFKHTALECLNGEPVSF